MPGGNIMKDETLERIWKQRQAISERCGYDSHKLVRYYQKRSQTTVDNAKKVTLPTGSTK